MPKPVEDEGPSEALWTVSMRTDQWELIVFAMQSIRHMSTGTAQFNIDHLARKFLRRRCDEIISDIKSTVEGIENE